MWVAGAELAGGGDVEVVRNPATEEPLAEVPSATPQQVDRAVIAARAALPGWRRTPAAERGELLHGVAAWLRDHSDELGRLMATEGGKPLVENTDEVGWTANAFSYYAELGRHERGRVIPSVEDGQLALVLKEPVGAVAVIVPWNYPLLLLAWKVAPALAAGNTVVVKPSPYTPLATLRLAEAFAGLPDGVVNLVTGGAEAGEAMVVHPGTSLVAFTGSVATGQRIGALCAAQVKRTHLELGGKDAFIVCDDVDLEVAAPGAAWAAYLNAGQVCTSAERFYVLEPVFDEFVDRELGWFLAPTVVVDVDDSMDLLTTETFGPVAPVQRVGSLDEAIARANALPYGLGANVYTRRMDYILRCMDELEAGTVWFNDPLTDNDAGPFGGMKMSGNARELGPEGLEAFRETKHVHLDARAERKPWWYPYGDQG
jgi:betaine-aldehyde dehydrogenase